MRKPMRGELVLKVTKPMRVETPTALIGSAFTTTRLRDPVEECFASCDARAWSRKRSDQFQRSCVF